MNTSTGKTQIGPKVFILSPFKGTETNNFADNISYAVSATHDCLEKGEAPFASHILYTCGFDEDNNITFNDDTIETDSIGRAWSIRAGLDWLDVSDKVVVYTDKGITEGMYQGIAHAKRNNKPIEYRSLFGKTPDFMQTY